MSSWPCQNCGTYHDTAACPQLHPPAAGNYECTVNGLTLGETQIIEKLDKIIEILSTGDS